MILSVTVVLRLPTADIWHHVSKSKKRYGLCIHVSLHDYYQIGLVLKCMMSFAKYGMSAK